MNNFETSEELESFYLELYTALDKLKADKRFKYYLHVLEQLRDAILQSLANVEAENVHEVRSLQTQYAIIQTLLHADLRNPNEETDEQDYSTTE